MILACSVFAQIKGDRISAAIVQSEGVKYLQIQVQINPWYEDFWDAQNPSEGAFKEDVDSLQFLLHKIKGDLKPGEIYSCYWEDDKLIVNIPESAFKTPTGTLFFTFKSLDQRFWLYTSSSEASHQEGPNYGFLINFDFPVGTVVPAGNKLNY